ncbi:MAG: ABC transporter permease [Flexilinea sp.]|jgi:ribose/xylose/arabinose/galactoside ABC-type transport system permease subunit
MREKRFSSFIAKYGMPLVLLVLIFGLQLWRPEAKLLSLTNIRTILLQTSVLGFMALGLSFVMLAGESDISFAGTLGMMSAIFTMLANSGMNYFQALFLVMLVGMTVSFLIAVLVIRGGFSAFIISISFMFIGLGIERSFNEGVTIWLTNESIKAIGSKTFLNFFVFSWFLVIMFISGFILVKNTRFGFSLRIVGENKAAATEAGISPSRIKIIVFILSGALYALAATIEPIRYGGSIIGAGQNYMLPALAACYLGSTMFTPGRVNIAGTFIGSLFMITISTFMTLLYLPYYFTPSVQGLTLLIAVGLSVFKNRKTIQQVKI